MKQNIKDQWLTQKDVCDNTGLGTSRIYRATRDGELRVSRKTGKNLFKKEWVDSFLMENE